MNGSRKSTGVPAALAGGPTRVLRPRDAKDVYAYPGQEFKRLADRGLLVHIATGYYVIIPQDRIGEPSWRPAISVAALGIAVADYGRDSVALMGPSAARQHGLIPRELSIAVVAVPSQRPALDVLGGHVKFVKRDVTRLDLERLQTELGDGWVTTLEQTVLDLESRRDGFGLPDRERDRVVEEALLRLDWELAEQLARNQRKGAAYDRLSALSERRPDA